MLKEILLKELIKNILSSTNEYAKDLHKKFEQNPYFQVNCIHNNSSETINSHIEQGSLWASDITLHGVSSKKQTQSEYIKLDLSLTPRKRNLTSKEPEKISITNVNEIKSNIVILGDPGSGKSTTLKYLYQELENKNKSSKTPSLPIFIRLRELNDNDSLYSYIESVLGIHFIVKNKTDITKENIELIEGEREKVDREKLRQVNKLIDSLNITLFIDGLDEIQPLHFKKIVKEVRNLSIGCRNTKIFLTCRSGSFDLDIEHFEVLELVGLSKPQIQSFIQKWLNNDIKAAILFNQIEKLPYFDSASRPLTLAHLISIYEKFNDIPEKPKSVYKKIIHLYLEEWNNKQSITRFTKYGNFQPDRKLDFLSHLAYKLTIEYRMFRFEHNTLEQIYKSIYVNFGLPENEYFQVTREIESHTGIIIQSGYELFEFAHTSLQEYLTAEYLNRLPKLPIKAFRRYPFPEELALAICLSSNPSTFFCSVILEVYHESSLNESNVITLLHRLLLEKPDFTDEVTIAISLLYMHSCVLEKLDKSKGKTLSVLYHKLWSEISSMPPVLNAYKKYRLYYSLVETQDKSIIKFKWTKQIIEPIVYNLPKEITLIRGALPKNIYDIIAS